MEHKHPIRVTKEEVMLSPSSEIEQANNEVAKKLLAQKVRACVDSVSKSNLECGDHKLTPSIRAFSFEDPDPFCLVLIFEVCCKKMSKCIDEKLASGKE